MCVVCTGRLVCHFFCAGLLVFVTRAFEVDSKWKPRIWTGCWPHFDLQFLQRTWWSFFEAAHGPHLSLTNFGGNQIAKLGGHRCFDVLVVKLQIGVIWVFITKVNICFKEMSPTTFRILFILLFLRVVHSQTKTQEIYIDTFFRFSLLSFVFHLCLHI